MGHNGSPYDYAQIVRSLLSLITSFQPPLEGGEPTGCRLCKHCGCMLNTEFTQVTILTTYSHWAADQEQEINFVWPKIVPSRGRYPLVRRQDKGRF